MVPKQGIVLKLEFYVECRLKIHKVDLSNSLADTSPYEGSGQYRYHTSSVPNTWLHHFDSSVFICIITSCLHTAYDNETGCLWSIYVGQNWLGLKKKNFQSIKSLSTSIIQIGPTYSLGYPFKVLKHQNNWVLANQLKKSSNLLFFQRGCDGQIGSWNP